MATGMQTDEYLSVNDLPYLLNEIYPISPHHIFSFGLQLHIEYTEILEFEMHHNNKAAILGGILYKALNRHPPLTKREIVKALRAPSVQEDRLANQIEANYIPVSQRGPQYVGPESLPMTQTGLSHQIPLQSAHQQPPSAPLHQTLTNIQPPPLPNTSQSFTSQQLTTELPRPDQPQSNLGQVGQSHQLPASTSMPLQFTPQTLQPQPGPSLISLQWTPHMPAVPQLTPSTRPQTHILPSSNNTQLSPWLEHSRLAASQQLTTEVLRLNQPQPNLDQVGQSHQLPASQRMSMTPQPGPQMQHWPQLQCPPHHPNYQPLPLQNHPGYPFPHPSNPPMHRPHESQSFPPNAPSHNQYSSFRPFHSNYSSVAQPPHDHYLQPFGNQSFTQLSQVFQPSRHTPYQQDQGHQSHQFQWQSSSQPPSQHHHSPVFPSQHFHTSDTNLPQTQESQSSPAPTFAATSESTPFLVPSPSPRQQPSPSPRQQPSPSPRQQPSPSPRQQPSPSPSQQPIPVLSAGSSAPPPAKRLRQQSPSPPSHSSPASEATASTAGYPPHVHDFISFVRKTYSAQNVLRDEKWSLSPTVKFINLACIDRKCVKSREYNDVTKAMVMDGNVDAIEETKGPITFSEIAKGISLPSSSSEQVDDRRLILVEGAPGVGKSTFAWEFCRRWMNGEIAQQYDLVLLLRLRDKRIREAKYLKDLFFHPSTEVSAAVCQELITSHTFRALIILEGYDELPDSCRNDPSSVFNELISGKLLPLATVLVTSRPWATKDLHKHNACHIYQHIEVLGFTKKQIKEYLQECIQDQKVRSDFNSYLEKHPQIRSGMYIPLNSAIVVAVYKESIENDRQTLPNTITELYSCCIEILIRRHLNCNTGCQGGNEMNLPAVNLHVPSHVHRNFVHMCHLAFSGIVEASEVKLIFSESELLKHFNNRKEFDNLGFMDSVTDLYVTGETVSSHNFLHLTFQEFFAAVHISTMSKEQQLQYFMEGKSDSGSKGGRLNVVLKFLAGLRELDCFTKETASHIVNPASSVSSYLTPCDITVGMDVVNWLFEAQSETAMSLILGERKVEFNASKSHMSPMDYYSLGYCISHSQCQWVLLLTGKIEISKEKIKMLADGVRDVTGEAKVVELGDDSLSHLKRDKLDLLFTKWNNILCLQKLLIEDEPTVWPDFSSELRVLELCDISDKSIDFLITLIKNSSSLRKFSISMAGSASECAHKLLELVQTIDHHPTLQEKAVKELGRFKVTNDVEVNALSQLCSKEFVSIRKNFISYLGGLSDDGVVVLAEIFQHKYGSRELNLSGGGTSDDGTVSLAKALHHNSTIHNLQLKSNRITDMGAVALVDALHHNSTLQSLNIYCNAIGEEGAVALADALHHNSTLQSLILSSNSIGDEGTIALANALHHNSTLQSLFLGSTSIGDEGVVALAEAILENQSLHKLYLAGNDGIGDRATGKFVEALTQNSSINEVYLPRSCKEFVSKCPNYHQVQTKLNFQ